MSTNSMQRKSAIRPRTKRIQISIELDLDTRQMNTSCTFNRSEWNERTAAMLCLITDRIHQSIAQQQ